MFYKKTLVACLFGASAWPTHAAPPASADVVSVAAVDLQRYLGQWFEIGSLPLFFQRNCVADTSAQYGLAPDGVSLTVVNRCRTADGMDEATGRATVVPGYANSRLKVSFFWPFKADYWVIGLDPDYRWALVATPNRKYLWLLSRTPQLPQPEVQAALAIATAQGYDLSAFRYTPQTSSP